MIAWWDVETVNFFLSIHKDFGTIFKCIIANPHGCMISGDGDVWMEAVDFVTYMMDDPEVKTLMHSNLYKLVSQ